MPNRYYSVFPVFFIYMAFHMFIFPTATRVAANDANKIWKTLQRCERARQGGEGWTRGPLHPASADRMGNVIYERTACPIR
jgi:hypothetical protein